MGADEQVVAALASARTDALVRGDEEGMGEILAPDFTYTNASGATCDREGYLAAYVTAADLTWLAQESSDPHVRVFENAAIVTVDVHDRVAWSGTEVEGDYRSLFVYIRRQGRWQCVAGQTTTRTSDTP